ncbi:hypothetical protein PHYPSEUDO_012535 [Phytophthora pseudosyringae]|uniref:Uncharacterized protein n=1 Tax=Phytophthora pseudosyringae TaxID=221518 RepID=A0A8T1W8E1_9STRA|nr:hypothetical protein PHYPSEUDO_012535 [Phytophthora pseudosyringae]
MMRRRGGRRPAPYEDEEDERVVYYDLEAGSHSHNLLLSPDAVSAPAQPRAVTTAAREGGGTQIFPRQQQHLFNLDDSGDEAEEEENPFATLLQQPQQPQKTAKPAAEADAATISGTAGKDQENSFLHVAATAIGEKETGRRAVDRGSTSRTDNRRSILKHTQQHSVSTDRVGTGNKKKLGFEAADSRPERWSTRKPSAADTKNRRKSLGAIQKRRSQLEASASKRRKSMPASLSESQVTQNGSSVDDSMSTSPAAPKRRLLSDVLQRATTLSQQQNATNEESSFSQAQTDESPTKGDAIMDTEHQMRAEPFAPQIFSPSKPASTCASTSRKTRDDAVVASKIRGCLGDVIRKAIRKRNRDLTLLRSHGQHLLPQQSSQSSQNGSIGAVESIQNRPCVVICLKRRCAVTPHSVSYEFQVHEVAVNLEKTTEHVLTEKHSAVFEVLFQPQTADYLKLSSGKLLKVYEPLHFVAEEVAAGSTSKAKWFLLSTQLTEVIEDSHHCAG